VIVDGAAELRKLGGNGAQKKSAIEAVKAGAPIETGNRASKADATIFMLGRKVLAKAGKTGWPTIVDGATESRKLGYKTAAAEAVKAGAPTQNNGGASAMMWCFSRGNKCVCDNTSTPQENWAVGGLTGLMDLNAFLCLKVARWSAAGRLSLKDMLWNVTLVHNNRATRTWENLLTICHGDVVQLAALPWYAGDNYVCDIEQPVILLNMTDKCSNIMPLQHYLYARNKQALSLCGAAKCVVFDLDTTVFKTRNTFDSVMALAHLKRVLCPHAQTDLQLLASP